VKTLGDLVKIAATGEEDDNSLFLERLITLLAKLPPHSHVGKQLTNGFVNTLWDSLEHPPPRTLDKDLKYREADGSYNNSRDPLLGASGTPYARTVSTSVFQNPDLPEPGIIFDSIMSRGDGTHFREHPNKISSMFFYLATIITHDCFQTVRFEIGNRVSYANFSIFNRTQKIKTRIWHRLILTCLHCTVVTKKSKWL
jgi:linoleate 8R-lipoxygenase/9,12-octadecadienoate 8-hydroperoxide 8R-isomerase/linoleate 8R-lipoxygenase/9,12-octadecadienoate 8-hydroperoxide 8S-isomerase